MNIDNYAKIICISLVLVSHLFLNNTVYASLHINFQDSHETIDSLLLAGDADVVKVKYENNSFDYRDHEDLEVLFNSLEIVAKMDSNAIDKYINHYNALSAQFNINYVGLKSSSCYEKFRELSRSNEDVNALKFYYIALFFKRQHLKAMITSARSIYTQSYGYYLEEKYSDALNTINSYKINSGNNDKLMALEDSIKLLQIDIVNKQIEISRWNKTELRTHKTFLGIIPSAIFYSVESGKTLKLENIVSSIDFDIMHVYGLDEIHINNTLAKVEFELSFSVNYLLLKKMMLGLDIGYSALSMNNGNSEDIYGTFFNFKMKSYLIKPYIKYLFTEKIGFNPFVNLGMGYQNIQYHEATGGINGHNSGLPGRFIIYGDLPLKSENRIGIICDIGVEYISDPASNFLYGSKIGGYYFLNQSSILSDYNLTFSIYFGLIL